MIITNTHLNHELLDAISKKLVQIKTKVKSYFDGKDSQKNSEKVDHYESLIQNHLSNTLGIVKLLVDANITKAELEHLASLKSSCDFLAERLALPIRKKEIQRTVQTQERDLPTEKDPIRKRILLISDRPVQKKILKNLLHKWGYNVQIIKSLPEEINLLKVLNNDLIVLSQNSNTISKSILNTFQQNGLKFLLLCDLAGKSLFKNQDFPIIEGPIDPDFLKYKIDKMTGRQKAVPIYS